MFRPISCVNGNKEVKNDQESTVPLWVGNRAKIGIEKVRYLRSGRHIHVRFWWEYPPPPGDCLYKFWCRLFKAIGHLIIRSRFLGPTLNGPVVLFFIIIIINDFFFVLFLFLFLFFKTTEITAHFLYTAKPLIDIKWLALNDYSCQLLWI